MKEKLSNLFNKNWNMPGSEKIRHIIREFSLTEKVIFGFFAVMAVIAAISLLWQVNKLFTVEVPDYGGTLTEGVVGSARFVNPLLAVSDTDRDLTSLIYSGLLKVGENGTITPDLAESYTISEDMLTYTFVIRENATFHDGEKVTADDVLFTISLAEEPNLKSPRKTNWDGVRVEKVDERTITFTLKQAYAPFIQNATLGILPKHLWKDVSVEEFPFSQYNLKPIGSGPYKIQSLTYAKSGLPSEYHLVAYKKYALGEPFLTNLTIKSYADESAIIEAYKDSNIESLHGVSPKRLPELEALEENTILLPLPRVFGVFFNQNVATVLVNKEVREALNLATDKEAIIDTILDGYGQRADGPIPAQEISSKKSEGTVNLEKAQEILEAKGWKKNDTGIYEKADKTGKNVTPLSFSISTGDADELKDAAYLLSSQWKALGAQVDVKVFQLNDLNQNIIRPRKYDALLFGEIIGKDLDLYPFWHSSQRIDPGLNIALYANINADKALENLRKTTETSDKTKYFENFNKEVSTDMPAVFTYSPYFIYIIPSTVHNVKVGILTTPSERFAEVHKWYIETNRVWKIFAN